MLGLGDLSRVMGQEGLQLVAAEGDEPKSKSKSKSEKKHDKADAPDPAAPPALPEGALGDMGGVPLMPMGPKFAPGSEVRDIFSGETGTVAEPPAGDFGDIVFVTFNGETHPIRGDQLEAVGGSMGAPMGGPPMTALPGAPAPGAEGAPAPGSPIPGAAPAPEAGGASEKPLALPDITKAGLKAGDDYKKCPDCGVGLATCGTCNGEAWVKDENAKGGYKKCPDCGVGLATCKTCNGEAWVKPSAETKASLKAGEGELRAVRVTFADGNTIETNMAAGLSDEDILKYYAVGKKFNVGAGEKDNVQAVTKVEILAAITENPDVTFSNNGSIIVVNFITPAAKAWLKENIGEVESWQMVGPNGVAVEPRYADSILTGMTQDDLVVVEEGAALPNHAFGAGKKEDAPKPTPKMRTGKKVRTVEAELVTAALDPRKLTYAAFLGALKATKQPTHQVALDLIGYVPRNWDLLVARLATDGVTLLSPKGNYDVMGLLKKGHNADEVRFLLAAKGVPVYSIDSVLKMVAEPTTPKPTTDPGTASDGSPNVWGWRDDLKMWVAVPAKQGTAGMPAVTA